MKIIKLMLIAFILYFVVNFFTFPERYITTWKYQLQEDIKSGDVEAIEYYKEHYTNKGIYLFE